MTQSDDEIEIKKLLFEQDQYIDTRTAQLLNHDPELVELYHLYKQWKIGAKALQGDLIELLESDEFGLELQNSIRSYKNVGGRIREVLPHAFIQKGVALDCAEAIETAGNNLKLLAGEIRGRIAKLPALDRYHADQLNTVGKAESQAARESMRVLTEKMRTLSPTDRKGNHSRRSKRKRNRP